MKAITNMLIFLFLLLSANCFAAKPQIFVRGHRTQKYDHATGGDGPKGSIGVSTTIGNNDPDPVDLWSAVPGQGAVASTQQDVERIISGSNLNNNQKNYYRKLARQAFRELAAAKRQKLSPSAYKNKVHQIINKYKSMPAVRSKFMIQEVKSRSAQRRR